MQNISRRNLLAGSMLLPLTSALARSNSQEVSLKFAPPESGREIMRKRYFPNLPMITHEGKRVLFYDDLLKDKIVVLNLMYANCTGICPTITAHLAAAQKILQEKVKQDIFIYSLTIKPEEDTPAKLKEYANMHHVGKNWSFLTGKAENVELLRRRLGFSDKSPEIDQDKSSHSGILRYGNEPMSLWGACQGSANPEWIAEEITFVVPREALKNPA